ncbi:hypothetical protein BASA50_002198 [Batrachochytrium salamandrivorans]|uniref:[RNA-polymerase]-subunit kinase n=1 Tax=Batrachochytrium salamandrivorans TaxID=1357716 RepID=A0ABQ8FM57_9FUNG|nr:hypothetical protein BASA62_004795 [Batrachochytrium salamandrivorans]KAH6574000.1 hypothetical protein BASA60_005751 [Batrachochytrium salamandrivorans]KAH6600632.1 hypothetical protein BASA50_002198 [Batrachochytrium salamandrivorans]
MGASTPTYSSYEKERKVGEGTYAVVYQGWAIPAVSQSELLQTQRPIGGARKKEPEKRKVAIKKIKVGQFKDGLDMSAIREVKLLKELRHPNIVELIDVFAHKTNLNLVLEFLDADLEMIIKNKNVVFSAGDIKSWMLMILRGLFHCHRSFILHRDLKPNNLLLSSNGQLKLADFGLAREFGDPSRVMTCQVVTRWYRAPELLLGARQYGTAVDMWSVGCIFAELMLRTPYFAAETDIGQLQIIFRALGTPTEEDWPGLKSLPDYHEFVIHPKTPLSILFTAASNDTLDLLQRMIIFDPLKRVSAEQALDHAYFRNLPRPTDPSRLPRDTLGQTQQHEDLVESGNDVGTTSGVGSKRKMDPPTQNLSGNTDGPRKLARKLF